MRRILPLALMLLLLAATVQAAGPQKQLPGDLTLAQAQEVLKAALVKAEAQGVPMNIAVVDAGGNLKACAREDGAFLGSIDVATKKARTARFFNMSTAQLGAASMLESSDTGIKAPDRPPTEEEAKAPPFFTASLSMASTAVLPGAPMLDRPRL